jgi:hypothetical protein
MRVLLEMLALAVGLVTFYSIYRFIWRRMR